MLDLPLSLDVSPLVSPREAPLPSLELSTAASSWPAAGNHDWHGPTIALTDTSPIRHDDDVGATGVISVHDPWIDDWDSREDCFHTNDEGGATSFRHEHGVHAGNNDNVPGAEDPKISPAEDTKISTPSEPSFYQSGQDSVDHVDGPAAQDAGARTGHGPVPVSSGGVAETGDGHLFSDQSTSGTSYSGASQTCFRFDVRTNKFWRCLV